MKQVEIASLERIAFFLEGVKQGKGDLLPLGLYDLEQLWNAIHNLKRERVGAEPIAPAGSLRGEGEKPIPTNPKND